MISRELLIKINQCFESAKKHYKTISINIQEALESELKLPPS